MLIGMALMKLQFLTGGLSTRQYQTILVISAAIGLTLSISGSYFYMQSQFSYKIFTTTLMFCFYFGSLALSLCYMCLLLLMVKSDGWQKLKTALAAVGKMAITNYLSQSLIGTFIFFGHGFGLFGTVDRTFLLFTVLSIWAFQIVFSIYWLKHFRYGPVEWLWRSLTYRSKQKLR